MTASSDPLPSGRSVRLQLERDVSAPGLARSALAEELASAGIENAQRRTIVLLVSEVVSNAVRHSAASADSSIELQARITDSTVWVAVTDQGNGFTPRRRSPEQIGDGYGLYLLERAATSWGVEGDRGTTVWFEMER